jgi:hypothetical protein
MEEHLAIYETLDEIKHLIPEQKYIELCDHASKLLEEIEKFQDIDEEWEPGSSDEDSVEEFLDNLLEQSRQEELGENPGPMGCFCREEVDFNIDQTNYLSKKCCNNVFYLEKCGNFDRYVEEFPLLENLVTYKEELKYNFEPGDSDPDDRDFCMKVRKMLDLVNIFDFQTDKIIISFAIYSYIFDNFEHVKRHPDFGKVCTEKLNYFMDFEDFNSKAEEFGIDYNKWKDVLHQNFVEN